MFDYALFTQSEVKGTIREQIRAKLAAKIKEEKRFEERNELPQVHKVELKQKEQKAYLHLFMQKNKMPSEEMDSTKSIISKLRNPKKLTV